MSIVALTTIGTVLGGVLLFLLLPVVARVGSRLLALLTCFAAALFCFFAGRLIARIAAVFISPAPETGAPLWAGFLPVRGVDLMIFGAFTLLSLILTILLRKKAGPK